MPQPARHRLGYSGQVVNLSERSEASTGILSQRSACRRNTRVPWPGMGVGRASESVVARDRITHTVVLLPRSCPCGNCIHEILELSPIANGSRRWTTPHIALGLRFSGQTPLYCPKGQPTGPQPLASNPKRCPDRTHRLSSTRIMRRLRAA